MSAPILKLCLDDDDPSWVIFKFSKNPAFAGLIKRLVKPASYARFNTKHRRWEVHAQKLGVILPTALRLFDHVDWSDLPEFLQISILQAVGSSSASPGMSAVYEEESPYDTLYLKRTAPMYVVKAVYKVLARETHPDHGGSAEDFMAVSTAYNQIKAERDNFHEN